jgi:SAM-dependent methyltransferase
MMKAIIVRVMMSVAVVRKYLFLNEIITALALVLLPGARAQQQQQYFDVPFVPTPYVVIEEMLRLAKVTPQDYVMDLGSGDGRVLITAAQRYGANGMGVDLDGDLVAQSMASAAEAGVSDRVSFLQQDLFKTDFSRATLITMYLLPGVMMRLQPLLLDLKPGTRLVSHDFRLGDWKPDVTTQIRKNTFLWIVPAKVAGPWRIRVALPGGDQFSFVMVDDRDRENEAALYFEGRVNGDVIEGRVRRGTGKAQTVHSWRAVRASAR